MFQRIKQYQQSFMIILIIVCMGLIMAGGFQYVEKLRQDTNNSALQTLMTVTVQQQQAFDTLIREDQDSVHDFATYFTQHNINDPKEIRSLLTLPNETDSIYIVVCFEDGWICGTSFDEIRQLAPEDIEVYRSLGSSGVRDNYTGLYSGTSRFSYYETFTFSNGNHGLIQKSYNRKEVQARFPFAFYNDQGLSHVVSQQGDILLRPAVVEAVVTDNIFDRMAQNHVAQADIDRFKAEVAAQKTGCMLLSGDQGEFVYTYIPLGAVPDWSLVSAVPANTVTAEANQMLLEFQLALGLLLLLLFICAIFIILVWHTQQDLLDKEQAVEYQTQLFDIFTTYISGTTDDIYLIVDNETNELDYVSPNVTRVLGLEPDNLLAKLAAHDADKDRSYYDQLHSLKPGMALEPRNTERINPQTGEHKYFLENACCTLIQGRAKRVCCISDRTRERRTQNRLAEALHMAQAANEAKSAFLSSVSHDIRTPMNAIIGFLALMRDETDNPAMVMEYNKRIDAASQHLLGLINDVLDMNKIESGSATLNISEMDLAEVIDEINTIIRPQAKAKNQTFTIIAPPMQHEQLQGDKLRMNQILINLLSNAVKYTPEGGAIEMRVDELPQVLSDYSRIRFAISDNGIGMSQDFQKVIFDPFTREENNNIKHIQGTGLGMAITKSLVDLMGGTINVESQLGQGSVFTVELELRIQEQEDDPGFWSDHGIARIIVTDDDEEVCQNIVKVMAKVGVAADYATDGETAVRMMQENREAGRPYDLILLDWKMPKLDGMATARLIRQNYSEKIPILLLTAYDWDDIEQEAMEIGVNHFMPKPFFMSNFKAAVRRVMDSQAKPEQSADNAVQGMKIMVVDDIEVNQIILVKILSSLGAVCETAGNGQEAVDKFAASQPGEYSLILMDVQMPVMDGYTATRAIRASSHPDAQTLPIIAMTANAFIDDVRNAIESGMDAHIAKPVQLDKLTATIQQVLETRRKQA